MALRAETNLIAEEALTVGAHARVSIIRRVFSEARRSVIFSIGVALATLFLVVALIGPAIAPYNMTRATANALDPPSIGHWFGTDAAGFDVFSRVLGGTQVDLTVALLATAISLVVGSLVGLLASFFKERGGEWILRASDLVQAFPLFVLAMIYVTMAGRNATNIITVVSVLNVPIYVRLMHNQVQALRNQAYVEAARADGDDELSIAFRHVLPNSLTPIWAQASVTLGWSIMITAGLSFIGAGIRPPTPEWGSMIASGANGVIIGQWWMSVFPGIAISLSVFAFASVGELFRKVMYGR